jgi:hypothetical protein
MFTNLTGSKRRTHNFVDRTGDQRGAHRRHRAIAAGSSGVKSCGVRSCVERSKEMTYILTDKPRARTTSSTTPGTSMGTFA